MIDCESLLAWTSDRVTYDVVVLAAHRVRVAGVARANTDNGDGRAVQADEDVQVLQDDAEEAKDDTNTRRVGLYGRAVRNHICSACKWKSLTLSVCWQH